jgi:hypothetical protein
VNTEYFLQKKERKGISKEQIKKRKTKKKMWIERALVEKKGNEVDLKFEAKFKKYTGAPFLFQIVANCFLFSTLWLSISSYIPPCTN